MSSSCGTCKHWAGGREVIGGEVIGVCRKLSAQYEDNGGYLKELPRTRRLRPKVPVDTFVTWTPNIVLETLGIQFRCPSSFHCALFESKTGSAPKVKRRLSVMTVWDWLIFDTDEP